MKINWKWAWAEVMAVGSAAIYFLTPSLQVYANAHPGTRIATVIALILAMGLKPSSLQKTA
jgi:hypothetical protein